MLSRNTAELHLHPAMGTFAIDMSLAVFPFVALQKDLLTQTAADPEIAVIFRLPFRNIPRKNAEKQIKAKRKRQYLQHIIGDGSSHKEHHHRKGDIDDKQETGKPVCTVSAVKESCQSFS